MIPLTNSKISGHSSKSHKLISSFPRHPFSSQGPWNKMWCFYLCFCGLGCPPERTSPYDTRNLLPECLLGTPSQQRWRPCPSWPGTPRLRLPGRAATLRSITRRRSQTTPVSCSGRPLWVQAEHCPDGGSLRWCGALRSRSKPSEEAASWQEATAAADALRMRTLSARSAGTAQRQRADDSARPAVTLKANIEQRLDGIDGYLRGKLRVERKTHGKFANIKVG